MSGQNFILIGGNGFIGRHVAEKLLVLGHHVGIAARDPYRNMNDLADRWGEKLAFHTLNLNRPDGLDDILEQAYGVVNFVGVLYEKGDQSFMDLQAEAAGEVAEAAYENGAGRFVHISAIGANTHSPSRYAQSKAIGEINVTTAFPTATILRPSIVVGKGDGFFGRFSKMVRMTPFVLGFAGGQTRFQPVQVDDVADAIIASLTSLSPYEGIYELGGPKTYSFKQLLALMLDVMGKKRWLLDLPIGLARPMAAILERLPQPPLTRDQLKLLEYDNVVNDTALGFADLGMTPKPIEDIIESAVS